MIKIFQYISESVFTHDKSVKKNCRLIDFVTFDTFYINEKGFKRKRPLGMAWYKGGCKK